MIAGTNADLHTQKFENSHAQRTEAWFALWTAVVEDYTRQSLPNHTAVVDSKSKMVAAQLERLASKDWACGRSRSMGGASRGGARCWAVSACQKAAAEPQAPGARSSVPTRQTRCGPGAAGKGVPGSGLGLRWGRQGYQCPEARTRV